MLNLTNQNYQKIIQSSDLVVLKFSAPWCGPCKALSPVFKSLEEEFVGQPIVFAEVDCSLEVDISTQYSIKAVPTILIIKNNVVLDTITGLRTKDALVENIKKYIK